jgi:hypothetical protein
VTPLGSADHQREGREFVCVRRHNILDKLMPFELNSKKISLEIYLNTNMNFCAALSFNSLNPANFSSD